ncbi:hypothetical protein KGP36_04470 [Patescibacteria group bacterium]|nr:hypothetical protein [Patescibacteria group bacterium]
MKAQFKLDRQNFGKAIVGFIGASQGSIFFPFRVIRSSFDPGKDITVSFTDKPKSRPEPVSPAGYLEPTPHDVFTLSRDEVERALSRRISLMQGRQYVGNEIDSIDPDLPEEIRVSIEFVPQGSEFAGTKHEFQMI